MASARPPQWVAILHNASIPGAPVPPSTQPSVSRMSRLAAAMVEETRLLLHHLVSSNANFLDLLRADYGFLNAELATLYGLPAPESQFALLPFPAGTRGWLGLKSFWPSAAP